MGEKKSYQQIRKYVEKVEGQNEDLKEKLSILQGYVDNSNSFYLEVVDSMSCLLTRLRGMNEMYWLNTFKKICETHNLSCVESSSFQNDLTALAKSLCASKMDMETISQKFIELSRKYLDDAEKFEESEWGETPAPQNADAPVDEEFAVKPNPQFKKFYQK